MSNNTMKWPCNGENVTHYRDETMNCHDYCRYSRWCNAKGEIGIKEFDCPNYWHWDDVYMEAERDREYESEDYYEDEEDAE